MASIEEYTPPESLPFPIGTQIIFDGSTAIFRGQSTISDNYYVLEFPDWSHTGGVGQNNWWHVTKWQISSLKPIEFRTPTYSWPSMYPGYVTICDEVAEECFKENKPKQKLMSRLTTSLKKFLNPDLAAQVDAGYRTEGLALTYEGQIAAIEALLDATPAALEAFTISAKDVITEREKQK